MDIVYIMRNVNVVSAFLSEKEADFELMTDKLYDYHISIY